MGNELVVASLRARSLAHTARPGVEVVASLRGRPSAAEWLPKSSGIRTHDAPMISLREAELIAERGVAGDRAAAGRIGGKRQVTLLQREDLPVIAALSGRAEAVPELLRRNLVVAGINLLVLKSLCFAIGDEVELEGTGPCEPCAKMDEVLGEGGFQAMRGHGGITARVLRGGTVRIGDAVLALGEGSE